MKKSLFTVAIFLIMSSASFAQQHGDGDSAFAKLYQCYSSIPSELIAYGSIFHELRNQQTKFEGIILEGRHDGLSGLYFFNSQGSYFQAFQNNPMLLPEQESPEIESVRCIANVLPGSPGITIYETQMNDRVSFDGGKTNWSMPGEGDDLRACEHILSSGKVTPANIMTYANNPDPKYIDEFAKGIAKKLDLSNFDKDKFPAFKLKDYQALVAKGMPGCLNTGYSQIDENLKIFIDTLK